MKPYTQPYLVKPTQHRANTIQGRFALRMEEAYKQWMAERCLIDPTAQALIRDLFADWQDWAKPAGEYLGSGYRFSRWLTAQGFERLKDSEGHTGVRGIGLCDRTPDPHSVQCIRQKEALLDRWLKERCQRLPRIKTPLAELFEDWGRWADKAGEYAGSIWRFSDRLSARGFGRCKLTDGTRGFRYLTLRPQPTNGPTHDIEKPMR